MKGNYKIALVGNPNCGKTSIFNALTGSKQHVGNWPGVTVEKKEGKLKYQGKMVNVIDLPGIYSLGAYSEDELVARKFILEDKPDVIVNIIDSTNIERNLYLTMQLMEMHSNVIVVLNMMDEAKKKNININVNELCKKLKAPIVETIATKNTGLDSLKDKIFEIVEGKQKSEGIQVAYGDLVESQIAASVETIEQESILDKYPSNWLAIKILENDERIVDEIKSKQNGEKILNQFKEIAQTLEKEVGYEIESYIIDKKYDKIAEITKETVKRQVNDARTTSDKIDAVVTNKWLGIPIFAAIMFIVYQITMNFGNEFLGGFIDKGFGALGEWAEGAMANSPEILKSFIVDGLIGGMGAVFVFIPLLFTLYLLISFLEDSGYMARAAYVMDKFMNSIGLHGKTAVSLIIGSGCNVAGIMSTRTMESKKDRMVSILINPFVSCGARLPVYALFIGAFFADKKMGIFSQAGLIMFCLYALGIIIAIITGKIFSSTLFKAEESYFVMELPPYRMPTLKGLCIHMWEKSAAFLKKAGTIIFAIVVIVWALSNLPFGVEPGTEKSILGMIGSVIAPILKPAGFGNWQAGVALITGLGAKEAVVATMGIVYGAAEGPELTAAIQHIFTPLTAVSFMVFSLLYAPCAAAIGTIKRETNSAKWAWFTVIYTTVLAWIMAVLVYQIGRLLGYV